MNTNTATEYRNLPLAVLTESATNPRRIFEDAALKELAESIRSQGVLSPLLVRPLTDQSFEIVAGARRYRAAKIAEAPTVPVRIVHLTDAEALEAQLIELSIVELSSTLFFLHHTKYLLRFRQIRAW
jgi:ParB family chromosome partitioning protein